MEAHYPIRLKKILPLSTISVNQEAKLIIETPTTAAKITKAPVTANTSTSVIPAPASKVEASPNTNEGNKKNLLAVLQKKYGEKYEIEEVIESLPLSMEPLRKCWEDYTHYLETALKHSAAGTFKFAVLSIEDETHFTITVPALTAQKFVEQERMNLLEKIWDHFHNRAIQFNILVAVGEKEDVPLHLSLNSKQKYERMAAQYPLIAELKTKLNLEVYF